MKLLIPLFYVLKLERCLPLPCTLNSPPAPDACDLLRFQLSLVKSISLLSLAVTDGLEREGLLLAQGERGALSLLVPKHYRVQMLAMVLVWLSVNPGKSQMTSRRYQKNRKLKISHGLNSRSCREADFSSIGGKSRGTHRQ